MPTLEEKYEFPLIKKVLDSLQHRIDGQIYSKEDPMMERASDSRANCQESMLAVFGCPYIENSSMDLILREVHKNYLQFAKEVLGSNDS